ncbi:M60 family metallopeptidase [Vibrio crassostreae]|uniref:M60 family metallopeptidase n=1 Tax=Vibrio crassostreae TaxID=246167 RepID=UPI001B301C8A|nr:M60 family metallopeptidase [Vibrio crassostreae]
MKLSSMATLVATALYSTSGAAETINLDYSTSLDLKNKEVVLAGTGTGGRTIFTPTKQHVLVGDTLTVQSDSSDISVCINVMRERKLCEQTESLSVGSNTITSQYNGEVYLKNKLSEGDTAQIDISGGREMYIWDRSLHTDADFAAMLESSTHENIHLVGNKVVISGPVARFQEQGVSNPTELIKTWDEDIIALGEEQYGFHEKLATHHQPRSNKILIVDVGEDGWGSMYAAGNHLGTGVDYTFKKMINTTLLRSEESKNDGWGPWHEYGHTVQPKAILFGGGEVTVNITSSYLQKNFGAESKYTGRWDGLFSEYLDLPNEQKDFGTLDNKYRELFFYQFQLTFGHRFYKNLQQEYRNDYLADSTLFDRTDDEEVQAFIVKSSEVTGFDLRPYFEMWGFSVDQSTATIMDEQTNLKTIDSIWLNTDTAQEYTHFDFGNEIVVDYDRPTDTLYVTMDFYRVSDSPMKVKALLLADRYIGSHKDGVSYYSTSTLDRDNALVKWKLKNKGVAENDVLTLEFTDKNGSKYSYNYNIE